MGDEDEGDADLVLQGLEFQLHLLAQLCVQGTEGFVEQQHPGAADQSPGEGDPLTLAAGELCGTSGAVALQADPGERRAGLPQPLGLGHLADLQGVGDVLLHRHVREEGVVLEDGVDVAFEGGEAGDVLPGEFDPSLGGRLETGDQPQHRGLARAGGAEHGEELAVAHGQVDTVDGDRLPERLAQALKPDRHSLHAGTLLALMDVGRKHMKSDVTAQDRLRGQLESAAEVVAVRQRDADGRAPGGVGTDGGGDTSGTAAGATGVGRGLTGARTMVFAWLDPGRSAYPDDTHWTGSPSPAPRGGAPCRARTSAVCAPTPTASRCRNPSGARAASPGWPRPGCACATSRPWRCRCRGRCPPPRIWFSARARVAASADPAHLTGSLTRGPDFAAVLRTARTATWAGLTLVPCAGLPLVLVLDERHPRAGHGTSTTPSAT